ncbi:hypothetical protein F383_25558 [Gossypium arboreum]|uniref:Uncharacterized protein n=1 Tax=Gossypium arboreum TaxID=29729 RepID=A0A0B0NZS8_GOSAR|nr:hypothetical protein F383_25558 [Gossypium arboreum]
MPMPYPRYGLIRDLINPKCRDICTLCIPKVQLAFITSILYQTISIILTKINIQFMQH